jgi:hypothetical protein
VEHGATGMPRKHIHTHLRHEKIYTRTRTHTYTEHGATGTSQKRCNMYAHSGTVGHTHTYMYTHTYTKRGAWGHRYVTETL